MLYIRPGTHALTLLQLLSVAGEFPVRALPILGSQHTLQELVHRLEDRHTIEVSWSGKQYYARLLSISGKRGPMRNIRLHKSALPILDELHPASSAASIATASKIAISFFFIVAPPHLSVKLLSVLSVPMPYGAIIPNGFPALYHFSVLNHCFYDILHYSSLSPPIFLCTLHNNF